MTSRNLLLINYEYPPVGGGAANATKFLAEAFVQLGHRVHVLTSGLRGTARIINEAGVCVHRLPVARRRPDRARRREMISFCFQSWWAVNRLQEKHGFDATVAFFTIPSGPAALRLSRCRDTPYVISLRGSDVPGHDITLNRMHIVTRPVRRAVLARAAAIVANSEGLATTSRAADPYPVRIIPNGVDCDLFYPAADIDSRPAEVPMRLLFVGRVHREKNLAIVLHQIFALPESVRRRIELQIAGDGAQRPELESLSAKLGLESQVHWLGWQAKEAVPALYRSADALVNPSQYEGMPNAVLEAMASSLPVLASDVPGNRAVVAPDETGVLFPLDQPAQMGAALARLAADPGWRRALGRAGRDRAVREFSWLKAAQSYLELLPPIRPAYRSS